MPIDRYFDELNVTLSLHSQKRLLKAYKSCFMNSLFMYMPMCCSHYHFNDRLKLCAYIQN